MLNVLLPVVNIGSDFVINWLLLSAGVLSVYFIVLRFFMRSLRWHDLALYSVIIYGVALYCERFGI